MNYTDFLLSLAATYQTIKKDFSNRVTIDFKHMDSLSACMVINYITSDTSVPIKLYDLYQSYLYTNHINYNNKKISNQVKSIELLQFITDFFNDICFDENIDLSNFDSIKQLIVIKLDYILDKEIDDKESFSTQKILDNFVVTYHLEIKSEFGYLMSINLNATLLMNFNISNAMLHQIALSNMLSRYQIRKLEFHDNIQCSLELSNLNSNNTEMIRTGDCDYYFITNSYYVNGSSILVYPNILKIILSDLKGDWLLVINDDTGFYLLRDTHLNRSIFDFICEIDNKPATYRFYSHGKAYSYDRGNNTLTNIKTNTTYSL